MHFTSRMRIARNPSASCIRMNPRLLNSTFCKSKQKKKFLVYLFVTEKLKIKEYKGVTFKHKVR